MCRGLLLLLLLVHVPGYVISYGTLPDASQEGILKQYQSYDDVALFHYTVPPETTRATWEFASFQDESGCPSREVMIYLQYGSYPVMSVHNTSFPRNMYTDRTELHLIKTRSAYQPHDSTIFPVYNPLPGTWFAAAYLAPYEEKIIQQGLNHKCRYSLGSIALWTVADQVDLIIPYVKRQYSTRKHFSYFKFFISENIDRFTLTISDCRVKGRVSSRLFSRNECIEYANIRDRALPKHDPEIGGFLNITQGSNVSFVEERPYKSKYYYLLIVSSAEVNFSLQLNYEECGTPGLYGHRSRFLPKEPKRGFQLFTVEDKLPGEEDVNFDLAMDRSGSSLPPRSEAVCLSTFDFTRIDNVEEFSTTYLLQGKSWYTKWVTVTNMFPILTRFTTLDYTDLGGTVNIRIGMDKLKVQNQTVEIYGCLSKGRHPVVRNKTLICDNLAKLVISSDSTTRSSLKLIPFPEPATWYLALQAKCVDPDTRQTVQCWGDLRFAHLMTSINLHIQPCGYRPMGDICGDFGVCVRSHKGTYMYTSCRCSSGYRGWTCDDTSEADPAWKFVSDTLLLTLSNLFFLPAVLLALYYRLYTEAFIYLATMFFSTFYHTCDQEMNHKHLPKSLEMSCRALYVSKEVLQFCDFFCAILSFWVTIISMARLPDKLVNFLHMFGVLLVAVLVQYNRSGIVVFVIPIPLGVLILLITLVVRSVRRGRPLKANRSCVLWLLPGILCAATAVLIFALIETSSNYQYVHSAWHMLIALSLVFLIHHCKKREPAAKSIDGRPDEEGGGATDEEAMVADSGDDGGGGGGGGGEDASVPRSESLASEESELNEVTSLDWTDSRESMPTVTESVPSVGSQGSGGGSALELEVGRPDLQEPGQASQGGLPACGSSQNSVSELLQDGKEEKCLEKTNES